MLSWIIYQVYFGKKTTSVNQGNILTQHHLYTKETQIDTTLIIYIKEMHTYTTSNIYLRSTYRHCNIYIASYIEEVCTDITTFTEAWPKYLTQSVVFVQNSTLLEKFNLYFSRLFCQYWQNFNFGSKTKH